jgi:hypothetical protein
VIVVAARKPAPRPTGPRRLNDLEEIVLEAIRQGQPTAGLPGMGTRPARPATRRPVALRTELRAMSGVRRYSTLTGKAKPARRRTRGQARRVRHARSMRRRWFPAVLLGLVIALAAPAIMPVAAAIGCGSAVAAAYLVWLP